MNAPPNVVGGRRTRTFTRERAVGTCKGCGRSVEGSTTVERRPWAEPTEHVYHWCDECMDDVEERPLDLVLFDALADLDPLATA